VSWDVTRGVERFAVTKTSELAAWKGTWAPSARMPLTENRLASAVAGPLQIPRITHGRWSAPSEACAGHAVPSAACIGQVPSSARWQSASPSTAIRCAGQQFWGPNADSDAAWHDSQMSAAQRRCRRRNIMRMVPNVKCIPRPGDMDPDKRCQSAGPARRSPADEEACSFYREPMSAERACSGRSKNAANGHRDAGNGGWYACEARRVAVDSTLPHDQRSSVHGNHR
jgi:hypothetical protein